MYTEQKFATGETITILTNSAGEKCSLKSWVVADENILVVEFESETDLDVEFDFYFPDEIGKSCEKAVDVGEAVSWRISRTECSLDW
ncbi:MAG: hypothetical protein ACLTZM_10100 [Ruminococcus sp.]